MDDAWFLVSYIALWLMVGLTMIVLVAVLRQIGLLHQRLGPTGAYSTTDGPQQGADLSAVAALPTLKGAALSVAAGEFERAVLAVVQPGCSVCEVIAPALTRRLSRPPRGSGQPDIYMLLVMSGDAGEAAGYAKSHSYPAHLVAYSGDLTAIASIPASPYAVIVDGQWRVEAAGLVNSTEQIDSLLEPEDDQHEHGRSLVAGDNGAPTPPVMID